MPLTDRAIRAVATPTKEIKLSDGGGLYLLVKPTGAKLWRWAYRFGGKQKALALGRYPDVSLAEAREQCEVARKLLRTGNDPSAERKARKQSAIVTFRGVAEEYLAKLEREQRAPRTMKKTRWLLDMAFKAFGERPIADITAPELLLLLQSVEARGKYETAVRLRSTCGRVFRYAIATLRCERDPSADLKGALTTPKVRHRSALLEPAEIGSLMRAIDGYAGQETTRYALKLAALLFVRPGELRQAEWSELDLDRREWSIPAHKMKMRRPHRVPLSDQAIVLIGEVRKLTGHLRWLFPSSRSVSRPMSENTLNAALRRLGYRPDEMTAHGFRAMAATRLAEMGRWPQVVIDRQLAHEEEDATRRAYSRGEHWSERAIMMQEWADYLNRLGNEKAMPAIIDFRASA